MKSKTSFRRSSNSTKTRRPIPHWGHCLLALSLVACGANSNDATDTKTNWLSQCEEDSDCEGSLSCLCGVCSTECDASDQCSGFDEEAACYPTACGEQIAVCALSEFSEGAGETDTDVETDGQGGSTDEATTDAQTDAEETESTDEQATDGQATDEQASTDSAESDAETDVTETDPETTTCDRPIEDYEALGDDCALIDFDCENAFYDECGCGCEDEAIPAECRPSDDYIALGDDCALVDFNCAGGDPFYDECGCGCETEGSMAECRPDDAYVALGDQCQLVRFACDDGEQYFSDDCGCGCEATESEDPCANPDRSYVADSPAQCAATDWLCGAGEMQFFDECGCGCEPAESNGSCEGEGKRYVLDDPAQCLVALFVCEEGEAPFMDDCGCGCLTDGSEQASSCPAPDGLPVEAAVFTTLTCGPFGVTSQAIPDADAYASLLETCGDGPDTGDMPNFETANVYAVVVDERLEAELAYSVADTDSIYLGVAAEAYCGGPAPPSVVLVVEYQDDGARSVNPEICYVGNCDGPPPP